MFSMGVILYELISGRTPFAETSNRYELLTRIRNEHQPLRARCWTLQRDLLPPRPTFIHQIA